MKTFLALLFCYMSVVSALAQDANYYFLFLNSNPDRPDLPARAVDSLQNLHMENMTQMAMEGKLLVAGPFEGGGGIFILNTNDHHQAEEWIMSDPAVKAGRFRIELLPWKEKKGKPCLASADAQMVKYSFVRYVPHLTKFNIQQSPVLFKQHDDYMMHVLAAHQIITYGLFVPNDGGVLILEGDPDKELILADPAVMEGMLYPEFKEIWLAKGSFCHD